MRLPPVHSVSSIQWLSRDEQSEVVGTGKEEERQHLIETGSTTLAICAPQARLSVLLASPSRSWSILDSVRSVSRGN